MGKRIDLTGQRFGRLVVLGFSHKSESKELNWKCRCDCGKTVIRGRSLKRNRRNSCGCWQKEIVAALGKIVGKRSNPHRKPKGEAAFNTLYAQYKSQSVKRSYLFKLPKKEFRILTKQLCHYCGKKPLQVWRKKPCYGNYLYNGIDRIDNNKGYVKGNVVACCAMCNQMKMAYSQEEFLTHIEQIYKHLYL